MYCPKCGKETNDGDVFCSFCGERLEGENNSVIAAGEYPKKKNHKVLICLMSVAVIILLIAIINLVPGNKTSPKKGNASAKSETAKKIYKANETISYKNFLVTANGFGSSDVLYDGENSMFEATPDSKDDTFVVCDITVKNNGSGPEAFNETLLGNDVYLEDSRGSQFSQTVILGYGLGISDKVINPNSKVSGQLVFAISKDLLKTDDNKFYLVIGNDKFRVSM